ncbi:MAG: chemotaxis protein CheW [Hylemonella sp.]|nr:chemotaxis protein CheW [Hylemonella sp.]
MSTQTTTQEPVAAQRSTGQAAQSAPSIREFLAFKLGREEYGIDILRVQEIRSYEQPTRMANAPAYILGVMNLRGVIVPIIDMRIKFGMAEVKYDNFTVVIVLNIGTQVVGMVVDAVSDVIALTPEQQRPVPDFSAAIDSNHVLAIGSVQDRMLVLLDIEKVMGSADVGLTAQPLQ